MMADILPYLMLVVGVFLGAIVQGLAGFAFSAVAGALLLHVRPPTEAVPLMMACSAVVQLATSVVLRRTMQWRGSAGLILGGAVGLLPALYLLRHVDTLIFRIGFGIFVASYAAYTFVKCSKSQIAAFLSMRAQPAGMPADAGLPVGVVERSPRRSPRFTKLAQWADSALGFASGLVGGLTAMPGALPTIWCDLQGLSKDQQRGLVQPFIASMQCIALVLLFSRGGIPPRVATDMLIALPALAMGSAVGIMLFMRVDDLWFKRVVLAALFVAGLALAV